MGVSRGRKVRETGCATVATMALLFGLSWQVGHVDAATATAPIVTATTDVQLDAQALYPVSYTGDILSYGGYQYAAWYTSTSYAVVGRRQLPAGLWDTVQLPHQLSTNDSSGVISLGVSPLDGRLHVVMSGDDDTLVYVKSEAGLLTDPATSHWDVSGFGAVQRTLDGIDLERGVGQSPEFVITPDNRLQLSYQTGISGNGIMELAEYTTSWSVLGSWQSSTGTYAANGATSATRSLYLHGLTYGEDGRLHAAFTWREGDTDVLCDSGGLANHDTGYVYSDDGGRTWLNNAGNLVAALGTATQVTIDSPGIVIDSLDVDHGLMDSESQAVDSLGQPHVLISYVPSRYTECVHDVGDNRISYARSFYIYRDCSGAWHKMEIPVSLGSSSRSQLVLDSSDNAYVIMPSGRIVTASAASDWTDWTVVYDGEDLNASGEVSVDSSRIGTEKILSIMYQRKGSGKTSSALRTIDVSVE